MSNSTGGPLPQPGWYPNPSGDPGYRWWDGRAWTEHVRSAEQATQSRPETPAAAPSAPFVNPGAPAAGPTPPPAAASSVIEPASNQTTPEGQRPVHGERTAPRYGELAEPSAPRHPTYDGGSTAPEQPRYGEYGAVAPQQPVQPQPQPYGQQNPYGQQQPYGQQHNDQQQPYGQQNPYGQQGYGSYPGAPGAYAPMVYPKAPEGAKIYGPFIWVQAILPILSALTVLFVNFRPYVESLIKIADQSGNSTTIDPSELALPTGLGWVYGGFFVIWAASVVLAYFDWKRLKSVGVVHPFHWAFAFIPVFLPAVYVVGRSVTVRRRSGRHGLWPIWALIVAYIVMYIITTVFALAVLGGVSSSL